MKASESKVLTESVLLNYSINHNNGCYIVVVIAANNNSKLTVFLDLRLDWFSPPLMKSLETCSINAAE